MEILSQSLLTFLLNASWQIVIVTAVAWVAGLLIRSGPARYRHVLWVAALAAAVLLPLWSVRTAAVSASISPTMTIQPAPATTHVSAPATAPHLMSQVPAAPVPFSQRASGAIIAAYGIVVLVSLARFLWAWRRAALIRCCARPAVLSPQIDAVWRRCLDAFELRSIDLLTSVSVPSPITVGAIGSAVIIPEEFAAESRSELLTAALAHELAHIARRDFALNLLYELLYLPVSFHPACWLIRRQIEQTREMACDEAVTSRLLERHTYARSILAMAEAVTNRKQPGYALGVFDGDVLEGRIRRLLQRPAVNIKRARLLLATTLTAVAACAIIASNVALTARADSAYEAHMKRAAEAYNAGDFRAAVENFTSAVALDPTSINAKLFLANALLRDVYGQTGAPDNRLLSAALQQYEEVLARDARNKQALAGLTTIAIDTGRFEDARRWAEKLAAVDPNDKSAWYTLGLLDWSAVYPEFQRVKQASGGQQQDYFIPDANARRTVREQALPRIEHGLQVLEKAVALDPQYDAAIAYMNLLYRLKSGLVDDAAEARTLLAKADELVGQAVAIKRQRPSTSTQSAALDVNGPPPGPAGRQTMVRAPPPPPPPPPKDRAQQIASALPPPPQAGHAIPVPGQYWQVLGTKDAIAMDLFRQLRAKGFQAAMHATSDEHVRVVVGPFFDEPSLDKAKPALENAGFRVIRKWE